MSITSGNAGQYGDSRKLQARARLHSEYTVAEEGWFDWVARHLPLKPGDRVLDAGCGPGWFWKAVAGRLPAGLDLTLLDLSPGMVSEAETRCRALPFAAVTGREGDAARLPFGDASFDAVVAMHMLYHVPDPGAAVAEMHRVLKPGGFLAVTTNGAGNLRELYRLTTVFGADPVDPAGAAFGFEAAEAALRTRFGSVEAAEHPARLRITDPEDVFLALTSYPPGEGAPQDQLQAFRAAIARAFAEGKGVLDARKQTGLFLARRERV